MQSNEQRRVIWRHPKGIYETVEVSGTGVFGVPYSYRETVYTARPRRTRRGPQGNPACTAERRQTGRRSAHTVNR